MFKKKKLSIIIKIGESRHTHTLKKMFSSKTQVIRAGALTNLYFVRILTTMFYNVVQV